MSQSDGGGVRQSGMREKILLRREGSGREGRSVLHRVPVVMESCSGFRPRGG